MKNKKKIAGTVVICIIAIIFGVWSQWSGKSKMVVVSMNDAPTPTAVATITPEATDAPVVTATPVVYDSKEKALITVHVCGCVVNPGVYELNDSSRITDAVSMAGGFSEEADRDFLNLADFISDGSKIYVPSTEETKDTGNSVGISLPAKENAGTPQGISLSESNDGLVNINTATKEELMTLNGVGESKALLIIEYRENNGGFNAITDIMNIRGIKEGLFNKIKDKIKV